MGDNWDDDDFEPEVASLAPPPEPEPTPVAQPTHKAAPKPKKEINMESLGRELTAAEREELQKRSDLKMAREMFGIGEDEDGAEGGPSYDDILTKDEFEEWGIKIGKFLATRHKAAHYGDLINKLILTVSEKLEAAEIRKISNHLKALADSKKDEKPKAANAGGAKKKKAQLKGASKANNEFDDYGGGGAGGRYDDFEDDFM